MCSPQCHMAVRSRSIERELNLFLVRVCLYFSIIETCDLWILYIKRISQLDHLKSSRMTESSLGSQSPRECDSKIVENQSQILQAHGLKPSGFSFPCIHADCCKRFRFRKQLYRHLATHYCGSKFGHWNTFVDHVYQRTGYKPYICPWVGCNYAGSTKANLKHHLLEQSTRHKLSTTTPAFDFDFSFRHCLFPDIKCHRRYCLWCCHWTHSIAGPE